MYHHVLQRSLQKASTLRPRQAARFPDLQLFLVGARSENSTWRAAGRTHGPRVDTLISFWRPHHITQALALATWSRNFAISLCLPLLLKVERPQEAVVPPSSRSDGSRWPLTMIPLVVPGLHSRLESSDNMPGHRRIGTQLCNETFLTGQHDETKTEAAASGYVLIGRPDAGIGEPYSKLIGS